MQQPVVQHQATMPGGVVQRGAMQAGRGFQLTTINREADGDD